MVDSVQAMASKLAPMSIPDLAQEWKIMGDSMVNRLVVCFSEIESREQNLRSVSESMEMRLRNLEERERKFEECKLLQEERSEELILKEEKLDGLLRLVHEHIERLEASQGEVEGFRRKECEKLKEIENKKRELDVVVGFLEKRLHEAEMREKEFNTFHNKKLEELALKDELLCKEKQQFVEEVKLANKELLEKQRLSYSLLERLETAQDTLSRMKVMMDERFKEIESREITVHESLAAKLNEADLIRESLEIRLKELDDIEKQLSFSQGKIEKLESSSEQQKLGLQMVQLGLKQGNLVSCQNSEMLINDPDKVLELMDTEIYKILSLSSDPAKLVLDAVERFYSLDSDTECKRRRATILLLDQLTIISPKIQPSVTDAATQFALRYRTQLCTTSADPMEILGFLHLLAAFNLSSSSLFNKDEVFGFLKLVGKHKETPNLCHALGLTDKVPGYIQSLINGKEFLLASTYVHEYKLQDTWKQSAILKYYVTNAKARNQRNTPQAQNKAIASEIADLRIALEHILKYGLESDYSPETLRARIQQLEANRASLRPSAVDTKRQERGKGYWQKNKRRESRKFRKDAATKSARARNPEMHFHGSDSWSALSPSWAYAEQVSLPLHHGPRAPQKRQRPNVWVNGDRRWQFAG